MGERKGKVGDEIEAETREIGDDFGRPLGEGDGGYVIDEENVVRTGGRGFDDHVGHPVRRRYQRQQIFRVAERHRWTGMRRLIHTQRLPIPVCSCRVYREFGGLNKKTF